MSLKDTVAEVLGANDIADVLGAYLELKPAGTARLKALCPFHKEKTPSFVVSRDRQTFYCFGCERGGDAITFIRDYEGLNFREALQKLADRAGIQLPEYRGSAQGDGSRRAKLLEVTKTSARYYRDTLNDPAAGRAAREYLDTRALRAETITRFGLGYARDDWSLLYTRLRRDRHEDALLTASGLVKRGDRGGYYDLFRNRIVFPIRDTSGNVVAFGGRALDDSPAKYINSPESPLYKKARVLYALYDARDAIREQNRAILVEGYFDVLRCFDAGIENAVAPCGTALTPEQASLVRRYAANVVVVFDGDSAGVRAALRSIGILTAAGLTVQALALPGGQDPDDYIKKEGADAFSRLVEQAPDFVTFYVRANEARIRTIEGRTEVARELFAILKDTDDALRRDEYIKHLARELGLNAHRCGEEFAKYLREESGRARMRAEAPIETSSVNFEDKIFVASLMANDILIAKLRDFLRSHELPPGPLTRVLESLTENEARGVQDFEDPEAARLYAAAASAEESWGLKADVLVEQRLRRFKKDALVNERARLQEEIENAQRLKDESKVVELTLKKVGIDREIEQVSVA